MNTIKTILLLFAAIAILIPSSAAAAPDGEIKSKFYDFSDQLIDGEIRKPQASFYSSRYIATFGRLLHIKRDFMGRSLDDARNRVFK